jgi:hypothetical protein
MIPLRMADEIVFFARVIAREADAIGALADCYARDDRAYEAVQELRACQAEVIRLVNRLQDIVDAPAQGATEELARTAHKQD